MDNQFPIEDLSEICNLTGLQSLSLANNQISEVSELEPLTSLENLMQLDLSECPIAKKEDYRKIIFEKFSNLQILDNLDVDSNPFEYSGESQAEEDPMSGNDDDDNAEADELYKVDENVLDEDANENGVESLVEENEKASKNLKKTKVE